MNLPNPVKPRGLRAAVWIGIATAALLGGCASGPVASSALLTYESNPEGAQLFEAGQLIGTAPVTRTYNASPGMAAGASIRTPDVTAVWPSGAKESYYTLLPLGADRKATIERPAQAAGLALDQENAKKFIAARQAEATRAREAVARDVAKGSARCREQQSRGGAKAGVDDCN